MCVSFFCFAAERLGKTGPCSQRVPSRRCSVSDVRQRHGERAGAWQPAGRPSRKVSAGPAAVPPAAPRSPRRPEKLALPAHGPAPRPLGPRGCQARVSRSHLPCRPGWPGNPAHGGFPASLLSRPGRPALGAPIWGRVCRVEETRLPARAGKTNGSLRRVWSQWPFTGAWPRAPTPLLTRLTLACPEQKVTRLADLSSLAPQDRAWKSEVTQEGGSAPVPRGSLEYFQHPPRTSG